MPIFYQQQINENTRLGVWKIEEPESFFKENVPLHRDVTHPHKRLQHLAGRFLLQYLFPEFPYHLIQIADTRKPFLADEAFHFSISHCGDYAAAIVSSKNRVGVDVEIPVEKILRIEHKFISEKERINTNQVELTNIQELTLLWSAKEAVFKWYGKGNVDFRNDIQIQQINETENQIECFFAKTNDCLCIHYQLFDQLVLCTVVS